MLVAHPDNAADELLEDGVNGVLAASDAPEDLADGDRARPRGGRRAAGGRRRDWFARNARRLSLDASLDVVAGALPVSVSVLIGAFNNATTLEQAMRSMLDQTVRDLELIVIDDGSADDSRAVARAVDDPRVRVIGLDANAGIARSLNHGLREARAPVVAVQDADDWAAPERLERQLAVLDARPDVAVVGTRMREVDGSGAEVRRARTLFRAGDVNDVLLRFNPIPNTSAAFRRESVLALGGYDAGYRYAMEYDLWLRLADRGSSTPSTRRCRRGA